MDKIQHGLGILADRPHRGGTALDFGIELVDATQTAEYVRTQRKREIGKLLRENIDCASPCFWGIIPEKTTIDEARAILENLGLRLDQPTPGYYTAGFSIQQGSLGGEIILREYNNLVDAIRVNIGGLSDPSTSHQDWAAFLPQSLFQKYGIPSQVRFNIYYPHDGDDTIKKAQVGITLYFDTGVVIADYLSGLIEREDGIFEFCPGQDDILRLWLWFGKDANFLHAPGPKVGKRINDVTNLTEEQFYELILGDPDGTCLVIKVDAFTIR